MDDSGQFKWSWLNRIPQASVIGKLTPVAGAALGGFYSWRLLEDVGHKSQSVFGAARFYINEHSQEKLSPLEAYFKAEAMSKKSPRLLSANAPETNKVQSDEQNDVITKVSVQVKANTPSLVSVDDKVEEGIQQLAEQHVVEHPYSEQQPALKDQSDELLAEDDAEIGTETKSIDIEPASTKHS